MRSAYIRFSRRFSSSIAFIWLTMDAFVTRQGFAKQKPERASLHTSPATRRTTRCSCHVHGKARPPARRLQPVAGSKGSGVRYIWSSSSESPHASCRENSTSAAPYLRGITHGQDSCCESSVVADCHEQLDTDDLQDQELVRLQPSAEAAWVPFGLV
jgi:hypothetical protein